MARSDFDDLVRIMHRLRRDCPWDRKQTHASLIRYLREESREVEQALRKKDFPNLREELGDLLLQIVFHAELAREKRRFTVRDVVHDLCRKLVRRHPHVFGGGRKLATAKEVMVQWRALKKREKSRKRT